MEKSNQQWQNFNSLVIDMVTSSHNNAFAAFLQRQMAEDLELKQHQLDWEEERARREEEIHEMRQKESRQQEHMNMLFQLAMTGLMSYFGAKKHDDDNNSKPPVFK